MRKLIYVAAATLILGAGTVAYTQLGKKTAPKPASNSAVAAKPVAAPEPKVDVIAGAITSSAAPASVAKPVVEPGRPPASIPKSKMAAKSKPKPKPKSPVPPKKVV